MPWLIGPAFGEQNSPHSRIIVGMPRKFSETFDNILVLRSREVEETVSENTLKANLDQV